MKKIIFYLLIWNSYSCSTQVNHNLLMRELYQFSISAGIIDRDSLPLYDSNRTHFIIKEIISNDTLLSQVYGIYQFETSIEDEGINIFFKKNDSFEIYDISNFAFFMPQLLNFLNDHRWSLSDKDKLKYINEVVSIFKNRFNSESNFIIEEKHNAYSYYIDFENYRKKTSIK